MSKQSEPQGRHRPEAIPDCPDCAKPLPLCICDSIEPIENRISLLILQHPQEQDRALGTARLTALHFKNAVVKIGLSWPSLSKALGRPCTIPRAGRCSISARPRSPTSSTDREIVALNRKGEVEPQPARHPRRYRGHRAARRHLEPGQGAVVAQCLDAEVPAGRSSDPNGRRATASCARSRAATDCPPSRRRRCCWPGSRSGRISPRR